MIKLHVCVYYVTYDDPAKPDCFNDSRKCTQSNYTKISYQKS